MYLRKLIEEMKASKPAMNYKQDKVLLAMYETNLTQVARLNSAHQIDFSTAKQLVIKLSDATLKRKYLDEITELKDKNMTFILHIIT